MTRESLPEDFDLHLLPPRSLSTRSDYDACLSLLQQFRGSVYLSDGAIPRHSLEPDGRHAVKGDDSRWHLYLVDPTGRMVACLWLAKYLGKIELPELHCSNCVSRMSFDLRSQYETALKESLDRASKSGLSLGESGGWAVRSEARRSRVTFLLPLAASSLYGLINHCLVLSTATHRHGSAAILRKLGGFSLAKDSFPLPPFYDPYYDCLMEVVAYDTRFPSPAYADLVALIRNWLLNRYPWIADVREDGRREGMLQPA